MGSTSKMSRKMLSNPELKTIVDKFKEGLTLNGYKRVFEDGKELDSSDLIEESLPEPYTKDNLIEKIFDYCECTVDRTERKFEALRKNRRNIDYTIRTVNGTRILVEAKPLNADLASNSDDGCINQVIDALKLHDVVSIFKIGIATDGYRWVFLNEDRKIVANLNVDDNLLEIKDILQDRLVPEYDKEEISKKFYKWYSALVHGGDYKDHNGKKASISVEECLEESIVGVPDPSERKNVATVVMNRLIFIKFLESRGIIKNKVIEYLASLSDYEVYSKMRDLFFTVMNTPVVDRINVNPVYESIPYLNGSLFTETPAEKKYGVTIKAKILKGIFDFLSSFSFNNSSGESVDSLDPEILGYIFEMSMMATDRKGTGAFYTPRQITSYISDDAIYSVFLENVKKYLKTEHGYTDKNLEELSHVEDIYEKLNELTLRSIFNDVLLKMRICDNACGSGAFLLAAADTLFNVYFNIASKSGMNISEIGLKKLILNNNIYGVDLNANATEIAKLRMWLWIVDSYRVNVTEALPNVDYNVRSGDSLLGYITFKEMETMTITIDDYTAEQKSVKEILKDRTDLVAKYKSSSGQKAKEYAVKIDNLSIKLDGRLSNSYYQNHANSIECTLTDFLILRPFHWGLAFPEVFEQGGFDVIVGNPPYIQLQTMDGLAPKYYADCGFETYDKMGDIFCLFYERSEKLLKEGGILSYITSNKWMRGDYGKNTRHFFIEGTKPRRIVDFSGVEIFADATVESSIITFKADKIKKDFETVIIPTFRIKSRDQLTDLAKHIENESFDAEYSSNSAWTMESPILRTIISKMQISGPSIKDRKITICYGVKTGCNDAFIIEQDVYENLIKNDPKSSEILRPILRGRDLKRYKVDYCNLWLIETHNGSKKKNIPRIDVNNYLEIKKHLDNYQDAIEKRADKGDTKYNLRNCDYVEDFHKNKIIWGNLCQHSQFAYDDSEYVISAPANMIAPGSLYLLAILNSKAADLFIRNIAVVRSGGYYEFKPMFVEKVPIPECPDDTKNKIEELARQVLIMKKDNQDTTKFEEQIDNIVYSLYGLNEEEIQYIQDN